MTYNNDSGDKMHKHACWYQIYQNNQQDLSMQIHWKTLLTYVILHNTSWFTNSYVRYVYLQMNILNNSAEIYTPEISVQK